MTDTIQVFTQVEKEVEVEVSIGSVIRSINEQPMTRRWNYIAQLLNSISATDDQLEDQQKGVITKYLKSKLELFS